MGMEVDKIDNWDKLFHYTLAKLCAKINVKIEAGLMMLQL